MREAHIAYLAAHQVLQSIWGAIDDAPPQENRARLWAMAAEVCQAFSFQMSNMALRDEMATFSFLQDLAAVHAQIEQEKNQSKILLSRSVSGKIHNPRIQ